VSQTQATSTEGSTVTTLAEGMRTDRETDRRGCPQPSCHGVLSLIEMDDGSERVCCETCRCTPDGEYLNPDRRDLDDNEDNEPPTSENVVGVSSSETSATPRVVQTGNQGQCVQFHFFYRQSIVDESEGPAGWFRDRDTYESGQPRMAGGYERVYDEDDDARPHGVGEAYTFDLSTL